MENEYKFMIKNYIITAWGYVPKGAFGVVTDPGDINKIYCARKLLLFPVFKQDILFYKGKYIDG